ncbi:hypothetical protein [Kitasatospora sp. NPDC059327]|uniref:hypothetical protein n=1 Tax=Kitasatospora sp. NPDC059327 TaxID=3346803 RepID=UPI0036C55CC0
MTETAARPERPQRLAPAGRSALALAVLWAAGALCWGLFALTYGPSAREAAGSDGDDLIGHTFARLLAGALVAACAALAALWLTAFRRIRGGRPGGGHAWAAAVLSIVGVALWLPMILVAPLPWDTLFILFLGTTVAGGLRAAGQADDLP